MENTRTFEHVDKTCFKKPCRNAKHYKLFDAAGNEIKDTFERIEMMRSIWH